MANMFISYNDMKEYIQTLGKVQYRKEIHFGFVYTQKICFSDVMTDRKHKEKQTKYDKFNYKNQTYCVNKSD